MKIRLAITVTAVLLIGLLSGCRDFLAEDYQAARDERAEAVKQVAELQAELTEVQTRLTEIQQELDDYRNEIKTDNDDNSDAIEQAESRAESRAETLETEITLLESELAKWQSGIYPEVETPPEPPVPLQEKDYRYQGFESKITRVHISMLSATWNDNKLTIKWELENTTTRKIYLNLLAVKAGDQMNLRGERIVNNTVSEAPVTIYPGLQGTVDSPWPGEMVRFTTVWEFGPLSEEVTIDFLLVASGDTVPVHIDNEPFAPFTVTR